MNTCPREIINVVTLLSALNMKINVRSFEDRVKLQKVVYIAQHLGLNLGYKFVWHVHGPYSRELAARIPWIYRCLKAGVKGQVNVPVQLLRLLEKLRKLSNENKGKNLSYWLELAASIIMLNKEVYPKPSDVVSEIIRLKNVARNDVELVMKLLESEGILR